MIKIKIDYKNIDSCIKLLQKLSQVTTSVSDPLAQSMGNATDTETAIFDLLQTILQKDLPALISNSAQLLSEISKKFQDTEQNIQSALGE